MRFFLSVILVSIMCFVPKANADIIYNIQSLSLVQNVSGATTGSVNVFVTATTPDIGLSVIGAQINVRLSGTTGGISGVTFGGPQEAANDLFPLNPLTPVNAGVLNVAASTTGAAPVLLPASAGLMVIPFSVAQGQTGTFTLSFDNSQAALNNFLVTSGFVERSPGVFNAGTVTITAVPEPTSILLLGGVATLFGVRRWNKRRFALANG